MIKILAKKIVKRFGIDLFLIYSWASTMLFLLLDVLPHVFRNIVFKLRLGKKGKNVMIDYHVYMRYLKNIEIGNQVAINRGCEFYTSAHLGSKIKIGNNVIISPNSKFYGAAQDYNSEGMRGDTAGDIVVGDDCWICADCTILQGVEIGKGSVIGAASVVVKNIPPYSIALGNPCVVVKKREEPFDNE